MAGSKVKVKVTSPLKFEFLPFSVFFKTDAGMLESSIFCVKTALTQLPLFCQTENSADVAWTLTCRLATDETYLLRHLQWELTSDHYFLN